VRTSDSAVLLDYAITHSVTSSSESFSIAGSANNGLTTVNFNLSGTMTTSAATVTFLLEAPARNFSVRVDANVDSSTDHATVNIVLAYNGNSLRFALQAAPNSVSGEIRFDGHLYATYSVTYDPATNTTTTQFTKASGQPMTAQELEDIQHALDRALDFSRFWSALLWPVGSVNAGV
jgi:hypothetical protein